MKALSLTHEDLLWDLAHNLRTPFVNVPLGSPYLAYYESKRQQVQRIMNGDLEAKGPLQGVPVADAVTVKPSYTRFCLHIYEVKASRADLFADLRAEKWRTYLPHCHRLYFAMPSGIATKDEIPAEAGLMIRGPRGWQAQRAAPMKDTEVPYETLLSMLFLKERQTRRERQLRDVQTFGSYGRKREIVRKFGKDLAKAWADRAAVENTKAEFEGLIRRVEEDIQAGLGHESRWPEWELKRLVQAISQKAEDLGVAKARDGEPCQKT